MAALKLNQFLYSNGCRHSKLWVSFTRRTLANTHYHHPLHQTSKLGIQPNHAFKHQGKLHSHRTLQSRYLKPCSHQHSGEKLCPRVCHLHTNTILGYHHTHALHTSASMDNYHDDSDLSAEEIELLQEKEYRDMFSDHYLLPTVGHRVFVIQPDIKWGEGRNVLTDANLRLSEACALIETLPRWKVIEKSIYSLKTPGKKTLFGKGNFETIGQEIRECSGTSAVFMNVEMLTPLQLETLQQAWKLPVYDRYTVVLQIFQIRAQTKEAKLQVSLAEIPYLRSRMRGMHEGSLNRQSGGLHHVGGAGETFWETRQRLLKERELKLKKLLTELKSKRQMLKKQRTRREIPTVAVVGYTNAGKTSLIKALTGDQSMNPKNQLFATLDVTVHAGKLGNMMKVLYVDTVGFISQIPTDLIASFSATLEDMLQADVVVHLYDASHPDRVAQRQNVMETLKQLNLSQELRENIIEVANKVDLLESSESTEDHAVSCVKGTGLGELLAVIQNKVMSSTGRIHKKLKLRQNSPIIGWLYSEATIEDARACPNDPEYLHLDVIMTAVELSKFDAKFKKQKAS